MGPGTEPVGIGGHLAHGARAAVANVVRPGEGRLTALFFGYFLLLETVHYAVKSLRQAVYIDSVGAAQLPWMYLVVALLSFPLLVGYEQLVRRVELSWLATGFNLAVALGLALSVPALASSTPFAAPTFYVWTTLAFGVAISQLWLWAAQVFDARQARRLFALIGAGGLLGGVPGGLMAVSLSRVFGTYAIAVGATGLMVVLAAIAVAIGRCVRSLDPGYLLRSNAVDSARGSLAAIRRAPLLRAVVMLMVMTVVVAQMVDLQFFWTVERHTTGLDQRTSVVGGFFAVMCLAAFVVQLLVTRRLHHRFGVAAGLRVLPATVVVAATVLAVALAGVPAIVFAAAWALKMGENGLRHSVDQASRELLFVPVPAAVRRRAKAFIDVFVQRASEGIAALLLLPVTFGVVGAAALAWTTAGVAALWLGLTAIVRQRYLAAFRQGLRADRSEQDRLVDVADPATVPALMEAVASADPHRVVHALELLGSAGLGRLVPPVLLHHHDDQVRIRTLELLTAERRTDAAELVEQAAEDHDPVVRGHALRALSALEGERASARISAALDDPDPRPRAASAVALLVAEDRRVAGRAAVVIGQMAADSRWEIRVEIARALGEGSDPVAAETLILLLYDPEAAVVRAALEAIRRRAESGADNPLYLPILISLTGDRRVASQARSALLAFGETAVEALVLFMNWEDEQIAVRRAVPRILARFGSERAARSIEPLLTAPDSVLRAEAVAALALLRRRHGLDVVRRRAVRRTVREEVQRYLQTLADLRTVSSLHELRLEGPFAAWAGPGRVPTPLQRLLASRLERSVVVLLGLLELILEPSDVRAARRSLTSRNPGLRANALEFLDNALEGALRRDFGLVVGDDALDERLRRASALGFARIQEPDETMSRLLALDTTVDPASAALICTALYEVATARMTHFADRVEALATSGADDLVRETARWTAATLAGRGVGERSMTTMARIEKMSLLQQVDLFTHLDADETLRMAAIAEERRVGVGETVFQRDDDALEMFCVVDGEVRLTGGAGEDLRIGARGRFGVLDILGGRRRSATAVAERETRLLVIEADDFFDLLASDVGIVRALFAQLVEIGPPSAG